MDWRLVQAPLSEGPGPLTAGDVLHRVSLAVNTRRQFGNPSSTSHLHTYASKPGESRGRMFYITVYPVKL